MDGQSGRSVEVQDSKTVDVESNYRRNRLERWWTRSPSKTYKIKSHPESVGGGSGRTLRRSSQLWPTGMECSRMIFAELRDEEEILEIREIRVSISGGSFI